MTFNKSNNKLSVRKKLPHKQIFENYNGPILHQLSQFHHSPLRYQRIKSITKKKQKQEKFYQKYKVDFNIQKGQCFENQEEPSEKTPRLLKHYLFKNKQQQRQMNPVLKNNSQISQQQLSHLKSIIQKCNRLQRCKTTSREPREQRIDTEQKIIGTQDQESIKPKSLILPRINKIMPSNASTVSKSNLRLLHNLSQKKEIKLPDLSQRFKTQSNEVLRYREIQQEVDIMQGWNSNEEIAEAENPSLDLYLQKSKRNKIKKKLFMLNKIMNRVD